MNRLHASDLLRYIKESPILAMGTDRAEVRSLSFVVMVMFFYQLAETGVYIAMIDDSITYKVAGLSALPRWAVAGAFFTGSAMLLPHLVALTFFPEKLGRQWPRALAARAGICGAVSWAMLAHLTADLDYEWLTTVYMIRCGVDLWVATILGMSLNAQQARENAGALMRAQRLRERVR